jgi:D-alanyl-D-alanine carboxypeptidase
VSSVFNRRSASAFACIGVLLLGSFSASDAHARARHHRHSRGHNRIGHQIYAPPPAALVVDANSGRTLSANNENQLRHPASLTKVMTLYLLYEQIQKGKVRLNDEITISSHAASMSPSKLGLDPGDTIRVEDAIKAIVTKSANDIAVAVAEHVGGTEKHFAAMMTAKAHALGMSRTHYENASGLPNDNQITTAHDLVRLARAIHDRFPRFYAYFSLREFHYAGVSMRNHNHLLGQVEGMDGIKTGFTSASGFNLLTSVKRGNRRIYAVVMGGRSAGSRDRTMVELVRKTIDRAATVRTAALLTEDNAMDDNGGTELLADNESDTPAPRISTPVAAPVATTPPPVRAHAPAAQPAPIQLRTAASNVPQEDRTASIPQQTAPAIKRTDRITAGVMTNPSMTTTTPSGTLRWVAGPAHASASDAPSARETSSSRPAFAKGMMIQVGVSDEMSKAQALLNRAKEKGRHKLAAAKPFTEKVQKGGETLYRARFAMASESDAEAACKALKRSGVSCFSTRN